MEFYGIITILYKSSYKPSTLGILHWYNCKDSWISKTNTQTDQNYQIIDKKRFYEMYKLT